MLLYLILRGNVELIKPNSNLTALSLKLTRWLSLIVFLLPLLALAGYIFEVPILTGAIAGFPPMRPSTAIGSLVLSLSIFLTSLKTRHNFLIFISTAFCLILGSFTLAGHFLPFPGTHSSAQVAINFILLSVSVFIYSFAQRFIHLAQLLILLAAINAEISLTGYIFNAVEMSELPMAAKGLGMSIQTGVGFILSAVAIVCSRPDVGVTQLLFRERSHSGAVARKLFLTVIFGPLVIGTLTNVGLFLGLYNSRVHDALFVLIFVAAIIHTTWQSAKQSEIEELSTEKTQQFLSEVSAALAEGLILESTLQRLAELAVKNLSDYCIVEIACDNEDSFLLKVVRKEQTLENMCAECAQLADIVKSSPSAFSQLVLKSRQPMLIERLTDEQLTLLSTTEAQLKTLKNLHLTSLLSVPMVAHSKFIGTLVLVSASPHRLYRDNDLRLAEELASRAALSFENSHLYNQAKNAITTREDILAVVSHDLKNPLTSIKLIGQTLHLLENPDKATCDKLAAKIENSANQMQVLIGDLLDFAKIESGTFSVTQKSENLVDTVRNTVESMQAQAQLQQQSLTCDFTGNLPKVNIDLPRITQVISNLLGNALKFTPPAGRITVSAKPRRFDVLVSVSDTGTGIPAENLTKIFDRFWQAETSKHKGSGLGLSIAKGIVQAHGGKIWAESQIGKGTTIYFTLPLSIETSLEGENTFHAATVSSEPLDLSQPVLKGSKILVVDDSPDNLFLIKHLLESMGAEVTVAESVKSALSNIKFSMPHVLFTDIEMPEETGYDLLSQLRHSSNIKNKTLPVIALTAHSHDQEMNRIKKAGFDFYLSKPINLEKMILAILQFTKHGSV